MKRFKYIILALFLGSIFNSCKDSDDELRPASSLEIKEFIWRAMNIHYLYKSDVPDLADGRFTTNGEFNGFLERFDSPESLFDDLQIADDDFSFITSNYIEFEKLLSGESPSNGMEFVLKKYPDGSGKVYGFVSQILPNTDAEQNGLKRGDIFNTIDGQQLNEENFSNLIGQLSYTIGLASFDGTTVTPINTNVSLTKREYSENPIFIDKVIDLSTKKVGYFVYNSFLSAYDQELNAVFGNFKAQGITDLVLDLRYNGGGSVSTAINLASMINNQSTDKVFNTREYNELWQDFYQQNRPELLTDFFRDDLLVGSESVGVAINRLNLNKVYILTTNRSASASELVINGLDPYVDVIQVGDTTRGKYQASITLYDSEAPLFSRRNANRNHLYALQPLVLKSINSAGFTDYKDGLIPDVLIKEDATNLGVLGDVEEPLLKTALDLITTGQKQQIGRKSSFQDTETVGNSRMFDATEGRMYVTD